MDHDLLSHAKKRKSEGGFLHGYALIIGIARYTDPRIQDLSLSIVKDLVEMHTVLRDPGFCGYHDDHVKALDNDAASAENIRDGLQWLARMAQTDEEATTILYFSGHGERIEIDGQISYYLYPYKCNLDELQSTALSNAELTQLLSTIRAPRLLVILDTCYSGGIDEIKGSGQEQTIFKGGLREADYQRLAQGQGRVIMASSRPTETSRSSSALNNSLFTHYLIEALRGKAYTHRDGLIRVNDVYNYASAEVSKQRPQHPVMTTHISENFPIALYRGGKQADSIDALDVPALREEIVRKFSLGELRILCADLTQILRSNGIDDPINLDLLPGSDLREKVQSLLEHCEKRGYLDYLITALCQTRRNLTICKQA